MERIVNWVFIFLFAGIALAFIKMVEKISNAVVDCKTIGTTAVRMVNGGFICVKGA